MDILPILEVVRYDAPLLSYRANERAVTHRIAVYLESQFPEWNVDCEYNRQDNAGDPKSDWKGRRRFPDIIVHLRGKAENLLVIEAKPSWASKRKKKLDREKLTVIAEKYGYKFAVVASYSSGPDAELWFESIPLTQKVEAPSTRGRSRIVQELPLP